MAKSEVGITLVPIISAAITLVGPLVAPVNCYDNAVTESFFSTLKTELVNHERYQTHEQARQSLFEWIEVFYNRRRRHSALGYLSPEAFEAKLN